MLSWSKEALQKRDIWHLKFLFEEDAVTLVCGDPWRTLPGKGGFRWPSLSGLYVLSNTQSKLNFSVFIYYFLMLNGKVFHDVKAIEKITVAHAASGILWNTGGWFWLLSISYFSLYMHTSAYCVCLCGASPHISSVHLQCSQRTLKQKGVLVIMDQHFIDIRAEAWEGAPWPRSDGSVGQSWRYVCWLYPAASCTSEQIWEITVYPTRLSCCLPLQQRHFWLLQGHWFESRLHCPFALWLWTSSFILIISVF